MGAEYDILKALRDTLINSASVTAYVPSDNIFVGPRRSDFPLPSICIYTVGGTINPLAGGREGNIWQVSQSFTVEISMNDVLKNVIAVADKVTSALLNQGAYAANKVHLPKVLGWSDAFDEARIALVRSQRWQISYLITL